VTASPAEDLLAYRGEVFINFRNSTYQWVSIKLFGLPEIPAGDDAVFLALVRPFAGGPVGVSTLAVAVGEGPVTVEEVCEPYLVRAGILARTPLCLPSGAASQA
jgi:Holliday junction resolvasome RuvABC ATP-dependent DNA helicase subunit